MLFNSIDFLLFFAVVVPLYFAFPHRARWVLLLAASYYFYASWKPEYLLLIITSTLVDYGAALWMAGLPEKRQRRPYLFASLAANLGLLFAFKYFDFFAETAVLFFGWVGAPLEAPVLDLLLPVGISFYTFQTLSYTIDVYRGRQKPERHLGHFALYVSFFPQLVAGPIERARDLLPQFLERHRFDVVQARSGFGLVLWGFFKKLVIADRLGVMVDAIHAEPSAHTGPVLILGAYLFAYQLYCDFSGYTDIARGTARILGFRLSENFRRPFAARSSVDFWSRWHITLTRWIRDYVYVPLARRASAPWQRLAAALFVFVLFGLWHGAAWTFVLFGLYVGVTAVLGVLKARLGRLYDRSRSEQDMGLHTAGFRIPYTAQLRGGFQILYAFHEVVFACILFRAASVGHFFAYVAGMIDLPPIQQWLVALRASEVMDLYQLFIAGGAIALLEAVQWLDARWPVWDLLATKRAWVRWPIFYGLILVILLLGEFHLQPFIYFQF